MSAVAASPSVDEPVQIGIASQWADDLMAKALSRWLRGFESAPKTKGDSNLLTTTNNP
jgi:hypothetical protein